jgi:hypothetical protein
VNFESIPGILKVVTTPLALAALVVLLLSQRGGLATRYGFILALVLGVIAFCSYTFQAIMPYIFPQQAEVWTVRGKISTDVPFKHNDELVFSSNPPTGEDDPTDNSFTAKVVVPRKRDGTLDFPKLHIGRQPTEKFDGRTIHLDENEPGSDGAERFAVEPHENTQELIINKAIELKKVPEYKGAGSSPTP